MYSPFLLPPFLPSLPPSPPSPTPLPGQAGWKGTKTKEVDSNYCGKWESKKRAGYVPLCLYTCSLVQWCNILISRAVFRLNLPLILKVWPHHTHTCTRTVRTAKLAAPTHAPRHGRHKAMPISGKPSFMLGRGRYTKGLEKQACSTSEWWYGRCLCCGCPLHVTSLKLVPYSSKFSWHNIFVNFVINLKIMTILFTN